MSFISRLLNAIFVERIAMKLQQLKTKDVFGTLGVCRNGQRMVVLVFMMKKLIRFGKMENLQNVVHRKLFVVAANMLRQSDYSSTQMVI